MGLDAVELVLAVEEEFQISILDEEAEKATTPGELVDLVWNKVQVSTEASCLTSRAFYLLRRRGMEELKLPRASFRPDTALETIVPRSSRKKSWQGLKEAAGAAVWPELRRPRKLLYALTVFLLGVFWACTVLLGGSSGSWSLGFFGAFMVVATTGWLLAMTTRPLKLAFAPGYENTGDLAQFLVARNPELLQAEKGIWTREQVWCRVRDIIINQTGATDFTEDSEFVKDIFLD